MSQPEPAPTPEQRAQDLWYEIMSYPPVVVLEPDHPDWDDIKKIAAEIRAAEQAAVEKERHRLLTTSHLDLVKAAVERRDREWCEAVGLETLPPKEAARLNPFLLRQAAARALEEAAEDVLCQAPAESLYGPGQFRDWLRARAAQIENEEDGDGN